MDGDVVGRRLCCEPFGHPSLSCEPGDYWESHEGWWYAITPNGLYANLKGHAVTEHEDKTISVTPSIRVRGHDAAGLKDVLWHGYLERGVWRTLEMVGDVTGRVGGPESA